MAAHFDRPDFDPDALYFVAFKIRHPGSESWPNLVSGCGFDNLQASTKTMTAYMDALVRQQDAPVRLTGRGLHSFTFRLDVSTFCRLHSSTFQLDVSTFCGPWWELSSVKTSQVELSSGHLLWFQ